MSDSPRGSPLKRFRSLSRDLRWRLFEFTAVVLTGAGQLIVAAWLGLHGPFITAASLFWLLYVTQRARSDPGNLHRWGFSRDGVEESVRMSAPPLLLGAAFCILFGLLTGTARVGWNIVPVLLLYPVWGLVQQFLVVALLAGNFVAIGRGRVSQRAATLIAALLFAAIHAPNLPLVAATFVMGLTTASIFFRTGTIWFAGPFHGWFATLFYYFVLGEDPWGRLVELLIAP
jgi:hypothetical protein